MRKSLFALTAAANLMFVPAYAQSPSSGSPILQQSFAVKDVASCAANLATTGEHITAKQWADATGKNNVLTHLPEQAVYLDRTRSHQVGCSFDHVTKACKFYPTEGEFRRSLFTIAADKLTLHFQSAGRAFDIEANRKGAVTADAINGNATTEAELFNSLQPLEETLVRGLLKFGSTNSCNPSVDL